MRSFNLQEYLKNPSQKIITRDGSENVRIICTNAKGDKPIVVLITAFNGTEISEFYYENGLIFKHGECNLDLFFEV